MTHRHSWLLRTKAHGLVQVNADWVEFCWGTVSFWREAGTKSCLECGFGPGEWSSVEVMSQATGYGNGFTRLEEKKAKGRSK